MLYLHKNAVGWLYFERIPSRLAGTGKLLVISSLRIKSSN
jgi:hypothetical protein